MAHGRATFEIGGVKRSLDVPISLALEIEGATDKSIAELVRAGPSLKLGEAIRIVSLVLEHHGAELERDELLEWAGAPAEYDAAGEVVKSGGIVQFQLAAHAVLNSFFARPETTKGVAKAGKPKAPAGRSR